ncbi:MAG TPA: response regulator transcription factor [Methylomirabilota bacterium]|nr:response regulator transcription factor [Methylomirabilota bacterium]
MSPTSERLSVLVVNADKMGSELLAGALRRGRNHFDVVALVGDSADINRQLIKCKPQVALISAELGDGPRAGLEVLLRLREIHPHVRAVMLLDHCQRGLVIEAFQKGARGLFYRNHSLKALSKCIRTVNQGHIWAGNEEVEYLVEAVSHLNPLRFSSPDGRHLLTQREEDVVRLVAEGLKNREIAESLHVTNHAIRNHLYHIFDKLGISTRVELVLYNTTCPAGAGPAPEESVVKARLRLPA